MKTWITILGFLLIAASFTLSCHRFPPVRSTPMTVAESDGGDSSATGQATICYWPDRPAFDFQRWREYLETRLELDSAAVDTIPAGRYSVLVEFATDQSGQVCKAEIAVDPGYGLGQRVFDAVMRYKEGRTGKISSASSKSLAWRRQVVTFLVEEEEETCERRALNGIIP